MFTKFYKNRRIFKVSSKNKRFLNRSTDRKTCQVEYKNMIKKMFLEVGRINFF